MDPSFRLIHRTFLSSQKSPWCPSHPQSHLHHWIYFSDCQHHLSIIFAYAHAQECRRRRGQQRMRWLDGIPEFEQSLGVGNGQGGLACCSPWGRKELDMTKQLNWTDARSLLLRHVQLFATPLTVDFQVPLSMGLSWQEYWSGLPFPPPGDLLNPRMEPLSPVSPVLADGFFITEQPGKLSSLSIPVLCMNDIIQYKIFCIVFSLIIMSVKSFHTVVTEVKCLIEWKCSLPLQICNHLSIYSSADGY